MHYVTPTSHIELLSHIVASNKSEFTEQIKDSIALSIRVDGSVDRNQIDKIYVLLKIISEGGETFLKFVGEAKQTIPGAKGLLEAVKDAIMQNTSEETYLNIMKKVSSICTDGCAMNTGEKNGLWTLFEKEIRNNQSDVNLIKLWCSAHRMELVFGDLTDSFDQIKKILSVLSSIASYFRYSGIRSSTLKNISEENNVKVLTLPKKIEIRWTQWTYSTVTNILKSWNALMLYFNQAKDNQSKGFFNFLSKDKHMKMITFLAELLHVYQRFHKNVQSDPLTIMKMKNYIDTLKTALENLQINILQGGWEEVLEKSIKWIDGKRTLNSFELHDDNSRRNSIDFQSARANILSTAVNFLQQRFSVENELMETIDPFLKFSEATDMRKVPELVGKDLSLANLTLQFDELRNGETEKNIGALVKTLLNTEMFRNYEEIATILCRLQVLSPQSCDVERCIKANNLLKTAQRNRLCLLTENKYLYVNINMPPLENWNPRPAIVSWLNEKERRSSSKTTEDMTKRSLKCFKGTFEQANDSSDEEHNEFVFEMSDKNVKF